MHCAGHAEASETLRSPNIYEPLEVKMSLRCSQLDTYEQLVGLSPPGLHAPVASSLAAPNFSLSYDVRKCYAIRAIATICFRF